MDLKEQPAMNLPLPMTDNIRHFGKGQTDRRITLPPGSTPCNFGGRQEPRAAEPTVESEKITVTVK